LATFSQLPGELGLTFVAGDEVNVAVNLQRNVQNYSFSSYIYRSDTIGAGGGVGSFSSIGATVVQPTIGIVDASTGSMIIGLSEVQTAQLTPGSGYRWFLRWVAPGQITRTIVSGSVTAVAP